MSSVQEDEEIHFAKNKESETDSLTEDDADPPPSYGSIFSLSSTQQSSDKIDVEKILSPTEDEINERNATGNFRDIATEIGQSIEDFGHRIETCALKVSVSAVVIRVMFHSLALWIK